jgi:hypothetical protein
VVPDLSEIGLSADEISAIMRGTPFPSWRFIPWILHHLGYELMRRPQAPEVEEVVDIENMTPEEKTAYEKAQKKKQQELLKLEKDREQARLAKEQRDAQRAAARERGDTQSQLERDGLGDSEEEIKVDDLSIDDLVLKVDEETGKAPFVGGFILLGFPQTELHAAKLKEHGIEFDRILNLTDPSEEDAGKNV